MSNKRVLLTGVTGFLGSHTVIQLLNKGYEVVGTLRSKDRISSIKEIALIRKQQYPDRKISTSELCYPTVFNL